jgi:DNA-binding XRE family transcriptional regulator
MNNDYYKFIKELRLKKGLKQADVAEKIGISRSSYIAFEQGKIELNLSEAVKLTDVFDEKRFKTKLCQI